MPQRRPTVRQPLKVQPVLTYEIAHRREPASWRSWGGIQKEEEALNEQGWHWMMSYGDYLRECNYALKKAGVGFFNLSAPKKNAA